MYLYQFRYIHPKIGQFNKKIDLFLNPTEIFLSNERISSFADGLRYKNHN